ncbi:MAG: alkyl/aryl-sulfatase [Proteobacteria bacterium]|nr:alkyl/aryl-sulfatase [Pseudomonadota bacterium]
MKIRMLIIIVQFVLIIVLGAALLTRYVVFGAVEPMVREPKAPGESTLAYQPLPPPRIPSDTISQLVKFKKNFTPTVEKVTDRIYLARGFALGSVAMVITDDGLVIVDTTESREAARAIWERFREITDQPVRYIIYTHSHRDHIFGAPVFYSPGVPVIATEEAVKMMDLYYRELLPFIERSRDNQSGRLAPGFARPLPMKGPFKHELQPELIRPTITFAESYEFELGGTKFELRHTRGETTGHLMVWLPEVKALFPGDLYYESFPNLSTPMLEQRPVKDWYEWLDRIVAMEPEYLVPSHNRPISGREAVREVLTWHSRGIRYVYDETVKAINEGLTEEEAVEKIHLPPDLAGRWHLAEVYGRVDWSVRGIYRALTGWYDGRGAGLNPLPARYVSREVIALAGGADKLLARAIELQKAGEHQLVCELCDMVIRANSKDKLAHNIKAVSLEYMGYQAKNLNVFGFYRSAAALERQAAEVKP